MASQWLLWRLAVRGIENPGAFVRGRNTSNQKTVTLKELRRTVFISRKIDLEYQKRRLAQSWEAPRVGPSNWWAKRPVSINKEKNPSFNLLREHREKGKVCSCPDLSQVIMGDVSKVKESNLRESVKFKRTIKIEQASSEAASIAMAADGKSGKESLLLSGEQLHGDDEGEIQSCSVRGIHCVYSSFVATSSLKHSLACRLKNKLFEKSVNEASVVSSSCSRSSRRTSLQSLPVELLDRVWELSEPDERDAWSSALGMYHKFSEIMQLREIFQRKMLKPTVRKDLAVEHEISLRRFLGERWTVHDPFSPGPFRLACIELQAVTDEIENAFKHYDGESSDPYLDRLLARKQNKMNVVFSWFLYIIGANGVFTTSSLCGGDEEFQFSKKIADVQLASLLGTVGKPGSGKFHWPGTSRTFLASSADDVARAFSIYMGRKSFVVVDPRLASKATEEFYKRVGTVRSEIAFNKKIRKNKCGALLRRICKVLFHSRTRSIESNGRAPNSGKSCIEMPRSKGGKREFLYSDYRLDPSLVDVVSAKTIYSGGKFRTITISSVASSRYSWLNEFMFTRLRECSWMIAGRSVEEWVEECCPSSLTDRETFCSGDLEAATDNFDPMFANIVIDFFCDEFDFGVDASQARKEMRGFITECKFHEKLPTGEWMLMCEQVWGQMMGSDFSFPILCLIGLLIGLESKGLTDYVLGLSNRDLKDFVLSYDKIGVNGDDYVTWGETCDRLLPAEANEKNRKIRTEGQRWSDTLEIFGGVPSLAKSPESREYFSVNSQLWTTLGGLRNVGPILPSMLSGINGKSHLCPHESWINIYRSPLLDEKTRELLELDVTLLPELPVSWGGLGCYDALTTMQFPTALGNTHGTVSPSERKKRQDMLLRKRMVWAKESRPRLWMDCEHYEKVISLEKVGFSKSDGRAGPSMGKPEGIILSGVCYVDKKKLKSDLADRFGLSRIVSWTSPDYRNPNFYHTRQIGRALLRDVQFCRKLDAEFEEAWRMERRGLVAVKDHLVVEGDRIERGMKTGLKDFVYRFARPFSSYKYEKQDRDAFLTSDARSLKLILRDSKNLTSKSRKELYKKLKNCLPKQETIEIQPLDNGIGSNSSSNLPKLWDDPTVWDQVLKESEEYALSKMNRIRENAP